MSREEKNEEESKLKASIRDFLRTRTNSELMDLFDLEYGNLSIWDTGNLYLHQAEEEWARRCIPESKETRDVFNEVHPEWADKDSMYYRFKEVEKQVNGLQKKVDKIVKLLESFEITMSVADALKM